MGNFWFKGDNSVKDSLENEVKQVPRGYGCSYLNLVKYYFNGYNFFLQQQASVKSEIFHVSLPEPRIVLCSKEGFEYLYKSSYLKKEPKFGLLIYNSKILDDHNPLIFENGELHDQRRRIFTEMFGVLFCKESFYKDISKIVETEMLEIQNNPNLLVNFEDCIGKCVCDIITRILLDIKLDYNMVKLWFENCIVRNLSWADGNAVHASQLIQDKIKQSTKFIALVDTLSGRGIQASPSEICNELVFSIIFNAHGAVKNLILSLIIQLSKQSEKQTLIDEAKEFLSQDVIQEKDLKKYASIRSFVLETVRMFPPATSVFRKAEKDFVMELKSGSYQINAGDVLSGNVFLAHRNPDMFEKPDQFIWTRFVDNPDLENNLLGFGVWHSESPDKNNNCAGRKLAIVISQTIAAHLMFTKVQFAVEPKWTGNNIKRAAGSDEPIQMKLFSYEGIPT